ncbi:MAG: hypothetical protein ACOC01_01070, partial [Bacteroidales bacterium]
MWDDANTAPLLGLHLSAAIFSRCHNTAFGNSNNISDPEMGTFNHINAFSLKQTGIFSHPQA